ncbi:hypothetical protein K2O51_31565 (plasmid) [Cupriavidus pinatubonensis]|uniref:HEPN domain-containing protein n=1 Tax=Cupriavidus pinatubonensis TaxID=248026 RepID=UPI001C7397FB|nr:HEPN domain-containing protein [Cupriavidus pinatubonensis]QYY33570.1 hypothetical protein K2O51_31565 [Cupriavidus pinatubonensis]
MNDRTAPVETEIEDTLAQALGEAATRLNNATAPVVHPSLLEAVESTDVLAGAHAALALHGLARGLDELVQADGRFPAGHQVFIRTANGSTNFKWRLGEKLLLEAAKRGSSSAAIDWALQVLQTKSATGHTICPVWGISIDEPVDLHAGMKLVPLNQVPQSRQLRWLEYQQATGGSGLITSTLAWQEIKAALILPREIKELISLEPLSENEQQADSVEFQRVEDLFNDATLALTMVGPQPVIPVAKWFTFDDPELELAAGGGQRLTRLHEILPRQIPAHKVFDGALAKQVVGDFLAMDVKSKARKTIGLALARLQQAMTRHSLGDAAVELSIALEALCGDESSTTEMTHKVTLRAVRFLGGDAAQRRHNFDLIKKMYGIRSKLVHRGAQPTGSYKVGAEDLTAATVMNRSIALCAELIRKLLAGRAIPDWTEIEIL